MLCAPSMARRLLGCLMLVTVLASTVHAQERYSSEAFGVSLPLPEEWVFRDDSPSAEKLEVVFGPRSGGGQLQLKLRMQPAMGMDASTAQAVSFSSVEGREGYDELSKRSDSLLGEELPGLQLRLETEAGSFRLRQNYLVRDGQLLILESAAAASEFEQLLPSFLEFWNKLELAEPSAEHADRLALKALAAHCGSEIDWAPDWDAAVERARAEGKLIMLSTRQYTGFALDDDLMSGVFMDRDVVDLLQHHYVPFRLTKGMQTLLDDHEVYGLGPNTFGQAVMLVTPDGEVLKEQQRPSERFLRENISLRGASKLRAARGKRERPEGALEQRANLLVQRGEFESARSLLEGCEAAWAQRLESQMSRRELNGPAALEALDRARELAQDDLTVDLMLDEARLRILMSDAPRARAALDSFLEQAPEHERRPEALLLLGALVGSLEQTEAAEELLRRIVEEHGQTRWAWQAAAVLSSTAWGLGYVAPRVWLPGELNTDMAWEVRPPDFLSSGGGSSSSRAVRGRAREARAAGVGFLLEHQQADGSWLAVTEAERAGWRLPDEFEVAITALCVQALLTEHRLGKERRVQSAIERALDWLHETHDRLIAEGEPPYYMDYSVWSRSYLAWALMEAHEAGFGDREAVADRVLLAFQELSERQQEGGGWSYYLTGDLAADSGPAAVSMSFTTAAAVLSMNHARRGEWELPEGMFEPAVDCLKRMRQENGTWLYTMNHANEAEGRKSNPAGEAARGPLCARALWLAGAGELEQIRAALDIYVEYQAGFAKELGKTLMHTGAAGQGSHYLMFDYANAAAAVADLPRRQQGRYADAVRRDVLRAQGADGSFVDTMLLGRAYGTAMAVIALSALEGSP